MRISLSIWDVVLLLVITAMGTLMAYIRAPRWKAFLLSLPLPFTVANLSLGIPVASSHALAMAVMLLFTHMVRWLHYGLRLPVVLSIIISAAMYMGLGMTLNRLVPQEPLAFWGFLGLDLALGVLLLRLMRHREEPAYRSPLPLPVKTLAISGVVTVLVVLKKLLGGFMTSFPMVGTIAAYEARHSLWTVARQIPVTLITMAPMMGVMWIMQHRSGVSIPASLAGGWLAYLAVMLPLTLIQNRRLRRALAAA